MDSNMIKDLTGLNILKVQLKSQENRHNKTQDNQLDHLDKMIKLKMLNHKGTYLEI